MIKYSKEFSQSIDRYLKLVEWAKRRYRVDGVLVISTGGVPSTYSRIEQAAWERHKKVTQ